MEMVPFKVLRIKSFENASSTAYEYLGAFIGFQDWNKRLVLLDEMKKITKEEVVAFAKELYGQNYVEVHKIKGEDKNIVKVQNPGKLLSLPAKDSGYFVGMALVVSIAVGAHKMMVCNSTLTM